MVNNFEDMFSGVDRIQACDGQTEGRRYAYASCGKNEWNDTVGS